MTAESFEKSYLGRLRALVGSRLLQVPGARVVIEGPDGRVLLQRRSDFGVWGVPGGNPEEGEALPDLIRRETLEETGLVLEDPQPFGYASDPRFEQITFPNGDRIHVYGLLFFATRFSGQLSTASTETEELAWFHANELPEMLPNMERTVEAYVRFKRSGEFQLI